MSSATRLLTLSFLSVFLPATALAQAPPAGIPQITTAPTGGTRSAGVSSTLTVTATGNATLNYQWLRGTGSSPTVEIAGATGASFTLSSPSSSDTAYYSVRVSNSLGSITTVPVLVAYEQSAGGLARTDLPTNYTATSSQGINSVIPQMDGSFIIGGSYTSVSPFGETSGISRNGLARFTANGALDVNFPQISASGFVNAMIKDGNGKILVAGSSLTGITDGSPQQTLSTRYGIARILADGTLDTGFNSPVSSASSAFTNVIAVESSGTLLIGGSFSNVIGQTGTKYLLRLHGTTGAADESFAPTLPVGVNNIHAIHLLSDGKIMLGHNSGLTLLNSDGTPAAGFTYGGGTTQVNTIQPLPGGDFLIGRNGTSNTLIRINSSGTLMTPFPASGTTGNQAITEILALPSGNFILGGSFTTYNGTTANRIAHIAADGTPVTGFAFSTGFQSSGSVNSLALDSNNNLWVGGTYTLYRGVTQRKLACLTTSSVAAPAVSAPTPDDYTQYLINAGIAASRRGTADDPDGDGSTNLQEFQNNTNPSDPASISHRLVTTGIDANVAANPPSTTGTYAPNTSVELTVTPDAGKSFLGWAPSGTSPADTANPLTVLMNQSRTLSAYAGLPIGEALDAPSLSWTTGGNVLWRGVASPSNDGIDAIRATGLSTAGDETWVETNVTGPGVLALRWTLNTSVTNAATLQVLANGSLLQTLAATPGGYQLYAINHTTSGPITLRIRLTANAGITANDSASIDQFHYGPLAAPTILPPSSLTATRATLNWTPGSGASQGYQLEVATNPAFSGTIQYYFPTSGSQSQIVSPLVAETTYYYRLKAFGPGVSSVYANDSFTSAAKSVQSIDFPELPGKTFGDSPFTLSATASSGLPVSYTIVSGPGVINGGTLTLTGGGDVVISATQGGNGDFLAAPPVERTLSVAPTLQTLSFTQPNTLSADPLAYHALNASASSGLPITFTVDSGPATIIDGMLQLSGTGLVRITASQSGNVSYLAAAPIVREFTAVAPAARAPMKLSSADKLPGGFSSTPTGISGDGSTLVGWATNAASNHEAFRGSPSNGITGLGDLPGGSFTSWANAVSQDGSVVVGYSSSTSGTQAFRWTSAGMVGMGDLPGGSFNSSANAVSQDGSVVVGYGGSSTGSEAFRWTQAGGMLPIGFLSGGNSSQAFGVSADGNTVVGVSTATGIPEMAFRWVALTGMTAIGDLPGGETRSRAAAISADGTVIVGQSTSARGREAFRWTTAGGMVGLGDLPGGNFESEALAVSADGSVVVGRAAVGGQSEAFMWDEANGMRKLSDVLNAAGLALGKSLVSATGISADGRFVTGSGTNAWLLDLNAPPPPAPTVALLWTENLPAAEPFRVDSVLRMSDENGSGKIDIATHIGSTTGGFNGVEYANGKILVPNQGISGGGIRTHHPDFSPLLVTNVFAYDLDEHPGELWNSNGNGQTITRSERSASPVISGGVYDYTYSALGSTNVGRFAFAIQKVGSTVYFSNPSNNPVGLYKMNSDGTGITSVLSASGSTAPVIYDFEVVGSFIYFGDITSNTIKRMNTDGSGLTTLVSVANFPNGIDVTDTAIYWSELQEGTIRRCDLNGGNLTELISGLNSPRGVAAAPISLLPVTDPLLAFLTNAGVPSNLRGPDDDPDGDQIPNLMEYALDLNPNGYGGSFTGTPPSIASTPTLLSYTYRRVRADVTYVVQTSPSLIGGTWTSGGVTQGMPAGDGTTTASIPVTPGSRFLRLSVSH